MCDTTSIFLRFISVTTVTAPAMRISVQVIISKKLISTDWRETSWLLYQTSGLQAVSRMVSG